MSIENCKIMLQVREVLRHTLLCDLTCLLANVFIILRVQEMENITMRDLCQKFKIQHEFDESEVSNIPWKYGEKLT